MKKTSEAPTQKVSILVVDDSADTLELISRNLEMMGHTVYTSSSVLKSLDIIETVLPDIVITDWIMPVHNGMDLIKHIKAHHPGLGIMMITGHATIDGAVHAVKCGADEYLPKPFTGEEILLAVNKMIAKVNKRKALSQEDISAYTSYGLIGHTTSMYKVFDLIKKAALSNATVLISGESGTGKELVARAIHYQSKRSNFPFVAVNCSAIPEGLIESELFGYTKGAFTGAVSSRMGFFQTADHGSIFLDEVSEMSQDVQVKLLRVLQERIVLQVGSRIPVPVDIRVIAASNKHLKQIVEAGTFREDLYYRLNIINIDIPPLRDRKNDLVYLINHFSTHYAKESGKEIPIFAESTLDLLFDYNYPGNVRELENIIQQLIVVCDTPLIQPADLPPYLRAKNLKSGKYHLKKLAVVEAEHIQSVVLTTRGNLTKAASILGIDRKTLRNKLNEINKNR